MFLYHKNSIAADLNVQLIVLVKRGRTENTEVTQECPQKDQNPNPQHLLRTGAGGRRVHLMECVLSGVYVSLSFL